MRRALLPLLLICAGCALDQRLVLTVTDVPPEPPAPPPETQPGLIPGKPSGKFNPELPKKPPGKEAPRAR